VGWSWCALGRRQRSAQLIRVETAADSEIAALHGESFRMDEFAASTEPRHERGIDTIDRRILRVLQADGRISNLKLAESVHLSPTAVLERVKRLQRDGYILGYEARLNPAKLEAGLLVFVEILLDRTVHDVMDTFKAAVQVRPEILEAHLVAGGFDYLLKTRVADMAAYREFIGSVIWTLPGVRETRTYAVMEEVKNSSLLAV
jgi:Lrp/AsnC family transcriptional regulator, leucine-responsive regulatory protein